MSCKRTAHSFCIVHPELAKYFLNILLLRQVQLVETSVSLNSHPENLLCWPQVLQCKGLAQILLQLYNSRDILANNRHIINIEQQDDKIIT